MTYLIAAAGTGGHVFPGLAVGEALVDMGVGRNEIMYVGSNRLEASVYPSEGFPFLSVPMRGLSRSATLANLGLPRLVLGAARLIERSMSERSVKVALGMGGYVTLPMGLAARRADVPVYVSEQNAEAGLANKVVSRWARGVFGSFPETAGLPSATWAGNPVRSPFWGFERGLSRIDVLERYGLTGSRPVVGVFGGSLGAGALNDAVQRVVETWEWEPVDFVHLTGERNHEEMSALVGADGVGWLRIAFEPAMEHFYAVSDLVIARAGGAVAELTATGTPSILVPGTFGSAGHQKANASFLEESGAAVVIEETDLDSLQEVLVELLGDRERLAAMSDAARSIAKPDAAHTIAKVLMGEVS